MRFFILILFLSLTTLTSAQNFQSGLITGISTSQVSGDVLGGFHKIGLQLGGFVNHPLGKTARDNLDCITSTKEAMILSHIFR